MFILSHPRRRGMNWAIRRAAGRVPQDLLAALELAVSMNTANMAELPHARGWACGRINAATEAEVRLVVALVRHDLLYQLGHSERSPLLRTEFVRSLLRLWDCALGNQIRALLRIWEVEIQAA